MISHGPVVNMGDRSKEHNAPISANAEFELAHYHPDILKRHLALIEIHLEALERALAIHQGRHTQEYSAAGHQGYVDDLGSASAETKDAFIRQQHEKGLSPDDISQIDPVALGSPRAVAKVLFAKQAA